MLVANVAGVSADPLDATAKGPLRLGPEWVDDAPTVTCCNEEIVPIEEVPSEEVSTKEGEEGIIEVGRALEA